MNPPAAVPGSDSMDAQIPQKIIQNRGRLKLPFFLVLAFSLLSPISPAKAGPSASENTEASAFDQFQEKLRQGKKTKSGTHYYWDNGLHIDSPTGKFRSRLNALLNLDVGNINADSELDAAFPNLEGSNTELRRLRLEMWSWIADFMTFRGQFDFSDGLNIQDLWLSFNSIPRVDEIKIGHFKEPFSLETLTSSQAITFMEGSLATAAFGPKRNMGIQILNTQFYRRMSWAFGAFLDVGDLDEEDEYFEAIDSAAGYNLTSRITGVPWYEDGGEKILHLGLSYSHRFRDDTDSDARVRYSTRPESRITEEKLVDTDKFYADGVDLICFETALVSGPLSFQGEYFRAITDSSDEGDPEFWGFYVYGSYFLTGESRDYVISKGAFTPEMPKQGFRLRKKTWGAWEAALRYSYIDLNDENIEGGKERNFTAGLNWYFLDKHRLMFNYVRAEVEDRLSPFVDDGSADILQVRFQISF